MTVETLRRMLRAAPFQPFTIRMADGRAFPIPHPEFLAMSPAGRIAAVWHDDGSASFVDLLLMTEVEQAPLPSPDRA